MTICVRRWVKFVFMDQRLSLRLENFKVSVGTKFQLYNSLFTSLPFHRIEKTGILLTLFLQHCEDCYKNSVCPSAIVDGFFSKYTFIQSQQEKTDLLFRFVQYAKGRWCCLMPWKMRRLKQ
jgi:phosphoenolpyruvate carboxylase